MKTNKNKLFALLLGTFILVSFSSCVVDDHEWREGRMDFRSTIYVAGNGIIRSSIITDMNRVETVGSYNTIDDIRFRSGYIDIDSRRYIEGFTLRVSNSDAFLNVSVDGSARIRLEGRQVDDFLNAVVEVVRRNGEAVITVDGSAANNSDFNLNFFIDIDAYVSY